MVRTEPLISVIVPVHNGQDYLENCIRSIEEQTYPRLEIIIVNDGSTDQTGVVCERMQRRYDNIHVLTMRDEGVSAARNRGIDKAVGELITFVDADDRLCPEALQILYTCMDRNGSDIAGCRFFCWGNEKEWQQAVKDGMQDAERRMQEAVEKAEVYTADRYLREAVLCGNSRCWSKLYRRQTVAKVRFQTGLSIGEDILFLVRMLPFTDRIVETEYQGYGYFQNPAGAMKREFTPSYMDQMTCWQLVRKEVLQISPDLDGQVTALYIMGIMLIAGKIAMLGTSDRHKNRQYVKECHDRMREALQISGAYERLSAGYRIKARVFRAWPALYLFLYHLQKSIGLKRIHDRQ